MAEKGKNKRGCGHDDDDKGSFCLFSRESIIRTLFFGYIALSDLSRITTVVWLVGDVEEHIPQFGL